MRSVLTDARLDTLRYAVLDLETTGLHPERSRIVEVALVLVEPDGSRTAAWHTLVDPGTAVTGTEVHGITTAHVRGAPRFDEIAHALVGALAGRVIVAHNAGFDLRHLTAELRRSGVGPPSSPVLCTMLLTVDLDLDVPDRKLATCLELLDLPNAQAHAALHDAGATGALLASYLAIAPGLGTRGLTCWDGEPPDVTLADDGCLAGAPSSPRPGVSARDLDALPTCASARLVAELRRRRMQPTLDEVLAPRCPDCEARLVRRHRRRDGVAFLSCLRYPACRFAMDA